jgi:hypothetical protein
MGTDHWREVSFYATCATGTIQYHFLNESQTVNHDGAPDTGGERAVIARPA